MLKQLQRLQTSETSTHRQMTWHLQPASNTNATHVYYYSRGINQLGALGNLGSPVFSNLEFE